MASVSTKQNQLPPPRDGGRSAKNRRLQIKRLFLSIVILALLSGLTIAQVAPTPAQPTAGIPDNRGFWVVLFEKNPGLGTIVFSSFLLTIIILYLNNRHARKLKEFEDSATQRKLTAEKELQVKYDSAAQRRAYENLVPQVIVVGTPKRKSVIAVFVLPSFPSRCLAV